MSSTSTQAGKRTATAWIVALTAIGSLMAALDTLVVSTSLSTIRLDLLASPDAFLDGFAPAVAVLAAFSAVGAIVALALPGRRPLAATSPPISPVPALEAGSGR